MCMWGGGGGCARAHARARMPTGSWGESRARSWLAVLPPAVVRPPAVAPLEVAWLSSSAPSPRSGFEHTPPLRWTC